MQGNRRRDTRPELAVRRRLHALGLRYRVDFAPLPDVRRPRVDIVFTRARVAVFIDGCYWHGCPEHYRPARINAEFWSAKIAANQERDMRSTAALRDAGWTVLRFWEHEPPDWVAGEIEKAVCRTATEPQSQ
ncbi:very short patch repair endonuclease [Nocardia salmonicida]|uniref:very short patch repair endonuclease n=1 Tax=Nocardia salmonicida TaxID=53431 RepID=UPI003CEA50B1